MTIDITTFVQALIIPELVTYFNSLPAAARTFRPADLPIFVTHVYQDALGATKVVINQDIPTGGASLADATFVWVGPRDPSGSTATTNSFLELSKSVVSPLAVTNTKVIRGMYVSGIGSITDVAAPTAPIFQWINGYTPSLAFSGNDVVIFSVQHWTDYTTNVTNVYDEASFDPSGKKLVETAVYAWIGGQASPVVADVSTIRLVATIPAVSPNATEVVSNASTIYTPNLADSNKFVVMSSDTPVTVSVPTDLVAGWQGNVEFHFEQSGLGQLSFTAEVGVVIHTASAFTYKTKGQYAVATLKRVAPNTWILFGLLEQV